jgi:hypothetical protein
MFKLVDNWFLEGDDKIALAKIIKEIAKHTSVAQPVGRDTTWYVVADIAGNNVLHSCPANPITSGTGHYVTMHNVFKKGGPCYSWPDELREEFESVSLIAVGLKNALGERDLIPMTGLVASDFATIGISGAAAQTPSYPLLCLVASQICDKTVTFVLREQKGVKKIIAFRSGGYAYIPQDEALALATKCCADGDIEYWRVSHFLTEVLYKFPQHATTLKVGRKNADIRPGIRYTTSDAGDASLSFELSWDVNGRKMFLASGTNKAFRQHRGEWNEQMRTSLEKDVMALKTKFTVLSDRMKELETIIVDEDKIERVTRHLLSDSKITGKVYQDAFIEYVSKEFAGSDANAAEIVLSIIEASTNSPVLKDLSDSQLLTLQHRLGELPYQRIRANI